MRLCVLDHAEAAVKVAAARDERDRLVAVEAVEAAEEGQGRDSAEGEAGGLLAPLVAGKGAALRML